MFGFIEDTWDWACDNPVKASLIVLSGGIAAVAVAAPASTIAVAVGKLGLLGQAGTGVRIAELSGIALEKASLAALGSGTIASGGGGIQTGIAVVNTIATTVSAVSGTASAGIIVEEVINS